MPKLNRKQLQLQFEQVPDLRNMVPESYRRNLKRRRKCNDPFDAPTSTNDAPRDASAPTPGEPKPQTSTVHNAADGAYNLTCRLKIAVGLDHITPDQAREILDKAKRSNNYTWTLPCSNNSTKSGSNSSPGSQHS